VLLVAVAVLGAKVAAKEHEHGGDKLCKVEVHFRFPFRVPEAEIPQDQGADVGTDYPHGKLP
jgi:hypothetical protein